MKMARSEPIDSTVGGRERDETEGMSMKGSMSSGLWEEREGLCAALSYEAWTGAVSERLCSIVSSVFLQGGKRQKKKERKEKKSEQ